MAYAQNLEALRAALTRPLASYQGQILVNENRIEDINEDPDRNPFPLRLPSPEAVAEILDLYLLPDLVLIVRDYLKARVAFPEYQVDSNIFSKPELPAEIAKLVHNFRVTLGAGGVGYFCNTSEWYVARYNECILSIHLETAAHSLIWTGAELQSQGWAHVSATLDWVYLNSQRESKIHIFDAHSGLYQGFYHISTLSFIVCDSSLYVQDNNLLKVYDADTGVLGWTLFRNPTPPYLLDLDVRGDILEARDHTASVNTIYRWRLV